MKRLILSVVIALGFPVFAAHAAEGTQDNVKLIHVADLDKMMSTDKTSTFVFDANNTATRKKEGVIPGAKTLSSSSSYDVAVLPADKSANLVFYCANTMCMASHDAAK